MSTRIPRRVSVIGVIAVLLSACAGPVSPSTQVATVTLSHQPSSARTTPGAAATPRATAMNEPTPASTPAATATGLPIGPRLPAHVFAPYLEMYAGDRVSTLVAASGATHYTLAFVETTGTTSCQLGWGGATGFTDQHSLDLIADTVALRAAGGDVIPSFGGYSADNQGREIGDSCADPVAIADGYQSVIAMLGVTRLDMDVEDASLNDPNGIDNRNKGLKILEDRVAAKGGAVEVQYTLPTSPNGLDDGGLAVLRNAVTNGTRVDIVNIMVFDYYDGTTTDMAAAAISAANALHGQLATIYPAKTDAQLWAMIGLTLMPGVDDYPKKTEVTTVKHAQQVMAFARQHGLATLSMWAMERDNGSCPGSAGQDGCSGIRQADWAFTRALTGFTGP
ncbi:MAG TPA: hypothetical protein VK656_00590 [Candidatus Acidoferrum sp.]|nr:hypothetical protein [Candidatus Acidoferrum sp.]